MCPRPTDQELKQIPTVTQRARQKNHRRNPTEIKLGSKIADGHCARESSCSVIIAYTMSPHIIHLTNCLNT